MSVQIQRRCENLDVSNEELLQVMKRLDKAIAKGLKTDTHPEAEVKCFPTFVQELPSGSIVGKYLSLDIGGTNFRVLMISCERERCLMDIETYPFPKHLMTSHGDNLFDYIAQCLDDFVHKKHVQGEKLDLALTFAFPVEQLGLNEGVLVQWTKGFTCEGVVGNNVVDMLKAAVERRSHLNITVVAILNDTTGCLVSCAYEHPNSMVGVIIDDGFNACYLERSERVETFDNVEKRPYMVINTEWGAFGDGGALDFLMTKYDRIIDDTSLTPGVHIFEKMVAGYYMGELVRLTMEACTREGFLFHGKGSKPLFTQGIIATNDIYKIESAAKGDLTYLWTLLRHRLWLPHATAQDCLDVLYICCLVTTRSAHLTAAGIACLINRTNFPTITVAVDGSVYRNHPHYHGRLLDKIKQLMTVPREVELVPSMDGSGKGPAFVSAVAAKQRREAELKKIREAIAEERKREQERLWAEERRRCEMLEVEDGGLLDYGLYIGIHPSSHFLDFF